MHLKNMAETLLNHIKENGIPDPHAFGPQKMSSSQELLEPSLSPEKQDLSLTGLSPRGSLLK